jgi:hypothetical protein
MKTDVTASKTIVHRETVLLPINADARKYPASESPGAVNRLGNRSSLNHGMILFSF